MAINLQHQDYTDENLENIIERSWNEWLSYDDVKALFESVDKLKISTKPIESSEEGLYLYPNNGIVDELVWDEGDVVLDWEDNGVVREVPIDGIVSYNVFETSPVKRTLERRTYESETFLNFTLVHYRVIHEKVNAEDFEEVEEYDYYDGDDDDEDSDSSDSSGDEFEEAGEDGDDGPPDLAAPVAAAAWAMDLGVDHPATDIAPVAATTLSSLHSDLADDALEKGCGGLDILQEAEDEVKTLNPLKSSEMKKRKRVFKRQNEKRIDDSEKDENRFIAVRGAHKKLKRAEKAKSLISKIPGDIAQSDILASIDGEIDKAKEEALSRKDILDKTEEWTFAKQEEKSTDGYEKDENRFRAQRKPGASSAKSCDD
uniref:65-kDa microtubule-associated protein 5 n=1 Tax=Noccaea caerulescens TaxID=107243 RepID=A0A1J3K1L0_NOCCA